MRIGLDCRVLGNEKKWAGVAQYTYNLVKNILDLNNRLLADQKNEYVLFWEGEAMREFAGSGARNIALGPRGLPIIYSHWQVAKKIDAQKLDLVHFPAGQVPLFLRTPYLVTVHDLAAFRNPRWFPFQPLARLITPLIWKRAKHLICVSQFTGRELMDLFKIGSEKLTVVYEGVSNLYWND